MMNRTARISSGIVTIAGLVMAGWFYPTSISAGQVSGGRMHDRRADHSSTLLPDGRVLITGGMVENGVFLNSAELYDPVKQTFVPTASMKSRRVGHSATLLPNGKVLIAGGLAGRTGPGIVATTEIFDPATGSFTWGPAMSAARSGQLAVALADKKILLVGGESYDEQALATVEVYDPASNHFSVAASMKTPRVAHAAVVLLDGRVLVTGGVKNQSSALASSEIYDPKTGSWQPVADMTAAREKHSATLLPDGRVLIIGGSVDGGWRPVRTAEIFDPRTNKFKVIGNMRSPRFKIPAAAAILRDGKVLLAGGAAEVEIYDSATGKFSPGGSVGEPHYFAAATPLRNGRVLVSGGYSSSPGRANGPLSTEQAWIYLP